MQRDMNWNQPTPIDIPWQLFRDGERLWQAKEGDDWPFTYLIVRLPEDGLYRSNVTEVTDHEDVNVVALAVQLHFDRCILRCMVSRPLDEFLDEMLLDLSLSLEDGEAKSVIERLKLEFGCGPSFAVRDIPFTMTRNGNMMSMGGFDHPWPFTYIVTRSDAGWQHGEAPVRPSRREAQADAQLHFNARIEKLSEGPFEHRVRAEMIEAARHGVEAVLEAARRQYAVAEPDETAPVFPD
jgi:hypothetical protein